MDISAPLSADLSALTEALDHRDVGLETYVARLAAEVRHGIASYLAMTMTIAADDHDVSFTVHEPPAAATPGHIVTSLLIPLADAARVQPGSSVVLYAGTPGAFVDLAADLGYARGMDPSSLSLDRHLPAPADGAGMRGLDGHLAINKAVGVLIDQGRTPESARRELRRLAGLDGGSVRRTAAEILLSVGNKDPGQR